MIADIVIIIVALLIAEKVILKEKYVLLSPFTMVTISFAFIYAFPLILYNLNISGNLITYADSKGIGLLVLYSRIFIYIWAVLSFISFKKISKKDLSKAEIKNMFSSKYFFYISIILVFIIVFLNFASVGFNVQYFIDKMIDPRNNTHFKEGLGPLTFIIDVSKKLLIFISIIFLIKKPSILSFFHLAFSIFISILGGAKTDIIIVALFIVLIYQRFRKNKVAIKSSTIIKIITVLVLVLIASFLVMSQTKENIFSVFYSMIDYPQEAYYSTKVLIDFNPNFLYWVDSVKSIIMTPIPRSIFKGKEYYDFFNMYWRSLYQPDTVIYHTSVYGFFSEGQMLFGFITPIIYPFVFYYMSTKLFDSYYKRDKLESVFLSIFVISQIYFILRIGIFEASFVWYLIISYISSLIVFNSLFNVPTKLQ